MRFPSIFSRRSKQDPPCRGTSYDSTSEGTAPSTRSAASPSACSFSSNTIRTSMSSNSVHPVSPRQPKFDKWRDLLDQSSETQTSPDRGPVGSVNDWRGELSAQKPGCKALNQTTVENFLRMSCRKTYASLAERSELMSMCGSKLEVIPIGTRPGACASPMETKRKNRVWQNAAMLELLLSTPSSTPGLLSNSSFLSVSRAGNVYFPCKTFKADVDVRYKAGGHPFRNSIRSAQESDGGEKQESSLIDDAEKHSENGTPASRSDLGADQGYPRKMYRAPSWETPPKVTSGRESRDRLLKHLPEIPGNRAWQRGLGRLRSRKK
jgi:hypothetical protein